MKRIVCDREDPNTELISSDKFYVARELDYNNVSGEELSIHLLCRKRNYFWLNIFDFRSSCPFNDSSWRINDNSWRINDNSWRINDNDKSELAGHMWDMIHDIKDKGYEIYEFDTILEATRYVYDQIILFPVVRSWMPRLERDLLETEVRLDPELY